MIRRVAGAGVVMAVTGSFAACGGGSSDTPFLPDPDAPDRAGSSHTTPKVFTIDACTMVPENILKDLELTQPGKGTFKPGTPVEELDGNMCSWSKRYSAPMLTIFITEGKPGAGRSTDTDAAAPVESTLDGRKTVRYTGKSKGGTLGSCETAIVVEPNVKVVVQADGSAGLTELCARVDKVLPSVSAKIPD